MVGRELISAGGINRLRTFSAFAASFRNVRSKMKPHRCTRRLQKEVALRSFPDVLSSSKPTRRSLAIRILGLGIGLIGLRPFLALALQPHRRFGDTTPRFFTADERAFVTAAVDRLLPADGQGPGGVAAEVPRFIDFQLAGAWGRGDNRYVAGPVGKGPPTLGNQTITPRADFYRASIAALRALPDGRGFADADPAARDAFLTALQKGAHDTEQLKGSAFFAVLLEDSVSGFLADPSYGGNAGFVGWALIGYPGVRYDWTPYLRNDGRKLDMPIVGTYGPSDAYGLN